LFTAAVCSHSLDSLPKVDKVIIKIM